MSRYTYAGPFDMVEIEGRQVIRGQEFDASDDVWIEELRRRGFHLFTPVEGDSASEATPTEAPAEEAPPAEPAPEPPAA